MKILKSWTLIGLLALSVVGASLAQDYPKATPRPKSTPTVKTPAASTPTPDASTPTPGPKKPTGPLKIIETDGHNKDSPIKITKLDYYDSGYGKYNSEVHVSCSITNSSSEELKKVTLYLRILNSDGGTVQEWKQVIGNLKGHQQYDYNPGNWYNSLGVVLHGGVKVTHEELPPKDMDKKGK